MREIALDSQGNIVLVGHPISAEKFPSARIFGPLGEHDVFVAKLSADGSRLLWMSILGGSGQDRGYGLALDAADNVYVAGQTGSKDFPTTEKAFDRTNNGGPDMGPHGSNVDAYALKLSADGSTLIYSTYLGGSHLDGARGGLAVDAEGCAYAVGFTASRDFLGSGREPLPGQRNRHLGGFDGFVVKLSPDGSDVVFSRFLGGSQGDDASAEVIRGVQVDPQGTIHVHGNCESADAATTPDAFDRTFNGEADIYYARISPDGKEILHGTFLGGKSYDEAEHRIQLDDQGNAYLVGWTRSPDFPAVNAHQPRFGGGQGEGFLVKLDPKGQPVFSTYVGGSENDVPEGPAVGVQGHILVAGQTESPDFEVTDDAYDSSMGGDKDGYLRVYHPDGRLLYSSFFGGSHNEFPRFVIATGTAGGMILAGTTISRDLPVTAGAFQKQYGGGECDLFVARFEVPIPGKGAE